MVQPVGREPARAPFQIGREVTAAAEETVACAGDHDRADRSIGLRRRQRLDHQRKQVPDNLVHLAGTIDRQPAHHAARFGEKDGFAGHAGQIERAVLAQ